MADESTAGVTRKRSSSGKSDDEPEVKKKSDVSAADVGEWDVNECRGDHESEEHWELRKQFLLQNMEGCSKSRLICLSQVFANVEFLGCRYPEETMDMVQDMSRGIVEEYREKQKTRLQRTFVKASDAAERKTKGSRSGTLSSSMSIQPQTAHVEENTDLHRIILLVYLYNNGENPIQIIYRSCGSANIPLSFETSEADGIYMCTCRIGTSFVIQSTSGQSKEAVKHHAAKLALIELQKCCYMFVTKIRVDLDGKEVEKDAIQDNDTFSESSPNLSNDNVGKKLLKLMGWTGGGLGKNEQGRVEAISVDGVVGRNRLGLGNATKGVVFQKKIEKVLLDHLRMGFTCDLKFSSDFSKDERKEIHMIAQRLNFKSRSYGKEEDRYLVVSEKVRRQDLITNTLEKGGETDRYLVVPPRAPINGSEQLSRLFSE